MGKVQIISERTKESFMAVFYMLGDFSLPEYYSPQDEYVNDDVKEQLGYNKDVMNHVDPDDKYNQPGSQHKH